MTSKAIYLGALRVESTHLKSGEVIISDAPVDNNGKGAAFSPTDTVATALASCMLTMMGIIAERKNLDVVGTAAEVTKVMASEPRRISEIHINLILPANDFSEKDQKLLEKTALSCPVAKSLHPDIIQNVKFTWL